MSFLADATENNDARPLSQPETPKESIPVYEETTTYVAPEENLATYETTAEYETTTTFSSPLHVQGEQQMEEDTKSGENFSQEMPLTTSTESMFSVDILKSTVGHSENNDFESEKSFSMDESMMDISKGMPLEETSGVSQGNEMEDQGGVGVESGITTTSLDSNKSEVELMAEFETNEEKYKNFPTSPARTRR